MKRNSLVLNLFFYAFILSYFTELSLIHTELTHVDYLLCTCGFPGFFCTAIHTFWFLKFENDCFKLLNLSMFSTVSIFLPPPSSFNKIRSQEIVCFFSEQTYEQKRNQKQKTRKEPRRKISVSNYKWLMIKYNIVSLNLKFKGSQ